MTQATLTDLQSAVQAASDHLADVLASGEDTAAARQELSEARAALQAHRDAQQTAECERQAAQAAEADQAAATAAAKATSAVTNTVARVQLPAGVEEPAQQHPLVAEAAGEVARIKLEIEHAAPGRQAAADEVAALQKRADVKRHEAAAIRSRRLAGHESPDDAGRLHLLEADATDIDGLVHAAQQRLHVLEQPVAALRQRLAAAEQKLKAAQIEGALHGQAERLRTLEAALVAGYRELRRGVFTVGNRNMPNYFVASEDLRRATLGTLA